MLCVVGEVLGITCLDNIMYVVCAESSTIRLYNTDTFSPLDVVINVDGMRDPCDIVVCRLDRQLYVAEEDSIWRVSVDSHSYQKWLTLIDHITSLSLALRVLVVTSTSHRLRQFNTTNKQQLMTVFPMCVKEVKYSVQTSRDTFIISHRGTDQGKYAVSACSVLCSDELHAVFFFTVR